MKKIILSLMLATSLSFGNLFQEEDKQSHMMATSVIGLFSGLVAKKHGFTDTEAFWIGFGTSMLVGLAKEAYDSRDGGSGFDTRDMLANGIGGSFGSRLSVVIYRFN